MKKDGKIRVVISVECEDKLVEKKAIALIKKLLKEIAPKISKTK